MPGFLKSKAIVLAKLNRASNTTIEFSREDYERPGHDKAERASLKVSHSTTIEHQMDWMDEQWTFGEDDGVDLIVHISLPF